MTKENDPTNQSPPSTPETETAKVDRQLLSLSRQLVEREGEGLSTEDSVMCLLNVLQLSSDPSVEALQPQNLRIIARMGEHLDQYGAQMSEVKGRLKGKWTIVRDALKQMGAQKTTGDTPLRIIDPEYAAKVLDVIGDAPVSEKHIVPAGWVLRNESTTAAACVLRLVEQGDGVYNKIPVTRRPVLLTAWVKNITSGAKCLRVAWKAGQKWRSAVVERDKLFDSAKIIAALANQGFPVNSHNRADLVRYLADYEDTNLPVAMPTESITEQMGWVGNGEAFLVGSQLLTADSAARSISFRPPDEGETQLTQALVASGTMDGWTDAVKALVPYPCVMLGIYASLAAPLLELLQIPGCVLDWSYRTSTGKSVILRAAASVWGNPDERAGASLVQTWNTTLVGFERTAAALKNIPVILDDTKTAPRPQIVADILYQAVAGHGRTRGSVMGSRRTASWRTIVLSTGERKATDFTKDAGSAARCLALWGSPFGEISDDIAILILKLERAIFQHHGHAGPRFVSWLLERDPLALRDQYDQIYDQIWTTLKTDVDAAVASRAGYAIAAIELAGKLAHGALRLPWEYVSPWTQVLDGAVESLKDTDRALEALEYVYGWAVERQELFFGHREEQLRGNNAPNQWAGAWDSGGRLGVTPVTLRKVLDEAGYEFSPTVKQWGERGWLHHEQGVLQAKVQLGKDRLKCYVLNKAALLVVS